MDKWDDYKFRRSPEETLPRQDEPAQSPGNADSGADVFSSGTKHDSDAVSAGASGTKNNGNVDRAGAAPSEAPDPFSGTNAGPIGVKETGSDTEAGAFGSSVENTVGSVSTGDSRPGADSAGSSVWTDWSGTTGNTAENSSAYGYTETGGNAAAYGSTEAGGNDTAYRYGGGFDGGGGNGSGYNYGYTVPPGGRQKKSAQPMQITKKAFVLILILAMLVTSLLTVGGIALYDNHFAAGANQATNYTLSSSTESLSYKSIISKTSDSVVSITTESMSTDAWAQNYVTKGAGSGVIIQSNGYIITCNHVIEGASKITVTLKNKKTYTATVVGTDSDNDIAVLKIRATGLKAATYGNSSKLQVGDQVVAIGNPLGELSNTATTGIISALNRNLTIDGKKLNLLQTDASINPGNSGGALFNSSGNLVGIVVAKSSGSDVEGLGFAIPINKAAKIAKQLIKTGKSTSSGNSSSSSSSGDAAIGVTVTELSESQAKSSGYDAAGVYISSVTSAYARSAGLESGDRIAAVDGTSVSSLTALKSALKKHSPGDKAKITIVRDGKKHTVTVRLTSVSN
ncbi:S1C family serine protease [Hornefia butyriciproducens]|uniref:S1C family serine protease n=1 Tax=Hornefia butyriciproducens TaxID=2652293 RepID=UPI0023F19644|nr:trypsin-like peptidase domain-containing protein [Hornefia butyriciproducens]MDD6298987.1 trypsin-like peptidase domain-containing protein [Hornefia butyriciproducens]